MVEDLAPPPPRPTARRRAPLPPWWWRQTVRVRRLVALAVLFTVAGAAATLVVVAGGTESEPVTAVAATTPTSTPADPEPIRAEPPEVVPTRILIPAIGVDADVIELGLDADRELEVPTDFAQTGWYTGRSAPGDVGAAVVVGHVDSTTGPAVFYRLRELTPGQVVEFERSDGMTARYRVTAIEDVAKDDFPTDRVYEPTEEATLRLITCGGEFDSDESSYTGNLIVYAEHLGNTVAASA